MQAAVAESADFKKKGTQSSLAYSDYFVNRGGRLQLNLICIPYNSLLQPTDVDGPLAFKSLSTVDFMRK